MKRHQMLSVLFTTLQDWVYVPSPSRPQEESLLLPQHFGSPNQEVCDLEGSQMKTTPRESPPYPSTSRECWLNVEFPPMAEPLRRFGNGTLFKLQVISDNVSISVALVVSILLVNTIRVTSLLHTHRDSCKYKGLQIQSRLTQQSE